MSLVRSEPVPSNLSVEIFAKHRPATAEERKPESGDSFRQK
ncbi:hypothetical protein [uncultured Victivallis sp.]|nr:hypothetical protein [uncultured Victivallis sp.]